MQPFPHRYSVVAKADTQGDVALEGERLPPIRSAPPTEFGGPGDRWSPETLFVAAVADCFVLTFRGIAGLSRFSWVSLDCNVTGTVDRVDRVTQFTALEVQARLRVTSGANEEQARRLLAKAEETCLVTNSLKVRPHPVAARSLVLCDRFAITNSHASDRLHHSNLISQSSTGVFRHVRPAR